MPTVLCPGCNRTIPISHEDLALTIECAACDRRFDPTPRYAIVRRGPRERRWWHGIIRPRRLDPPENSGDTLIRWIVNAAVLFAVLYLALLLPLVVAGFVMAHR